MTRRGRRAVRPSIVRSASGDADAVTEPVETGLLGALDDGRLGAPARDVACDRLELLLDRTALGDERVDVVVERCHAQRLGQVEEGQQEDDEDRRQRQADAAGAAACPNPDRPLAARRGQRPGGAAGGPRGGPPPPAPAAGGGGGGGGGKGGPRPQST